MARHKFGLEQEGNLQEFTYDAPTSLSQALSQLGAAGDNGRLLAGGTDLIIQMRAGVKQPGIVIDAKTIPELQSCTFNAQDGLRLGASYPCYKFIDDATMQQQYPGLVESAGLIGSDQILSRASVGGNLCNGSPAADTPPALIVLGATCHIAGPNGERDVAAEDFVTAPGQTVLGPGELLVELRIPAPQGKTSDCYLRFIPRNEMDIAVVGVGSCVSLDGETCTAARIALGAVAPTQLFAQAASEFLVGKPFNEANIARAAELAQDIATPISDMRGTAEFRTHLVGVLTRRTLTEAGKRARAK
jgi:CO/xanthine dehydrogenase FAD-binding subunit